MRGRREKAVHVAEANHHHGSCQAHDTPTPPPLIVASISVHPSFDFIHSSDSNQEGMRQTTHTRACPYLNVCCNKRERGRSVWHDMVSLCQRWRSEPKPSRPCGHAVLRPDPPHTHSRTRFFPVCRLCDSHRRPLTTKQRDEALYQLGLLVRRLALHRKKGLCCASLDHLTCPSHTGRDCVSPVGVCVPTTRTLQHNLHVVTHHHRCHRISYRTVLYLIGFALRHNNFLPSFSTASERSAPHTTR